MTTTHFAPSPTPGLRWWERTAVCGVTYALGAPETAPWGTSNALHVDCCACLDVIDARKRIAEAGDQCTKEEV